MKMIFCFRVCGSYESMVGGKIADALIDFTGGIDGSIKLHRSPPAPGFREEIKHLLCQACARKSMVGCSIRKKREDNNSGHLDTGLIKGKYIFLFIFQMTKLGYYDILSI
jgi:hypothetical protein